MPIENRKLRLTFALERQGEPFYLHIAYVGIDIDKREWADIKAAAVFKGDGPFPVKIGTARRHAGNLTAESPDLIAERKTLHKEEGQTPRDEPAIKISQDKINKLAAPKKRRMESSPRSTSSNVKRLSMFA